MRATLPSAAPGRPAEARGRRAWLLLAAAFALGSALVFALPWLLPADALAWRPGRAWAEPWRWWSAAFVHWNGRHLAVNLIGCAVVALFGVVAGAPLRATLAWLAAWPLTQLALLAQPSLALYGGLSGVLHAGVAVVAFELAVGGGSRERTVGLAVMAGLAFKIALEAPWRAALQPAPLLGIDVAPAVHATGAVAGLVCSAAASARACLDRRR